ncbi:hypothetical protein E2C01_010333 [Portunus trituberculatus]|uniref:Uncharacterized protein n=1 Tax=Portunus trituberculatus TaxID=210409 RepID=A0A5B7D8C9_PORTR|nr:hypothetical protein [Portunus trituberculatus]
MMRPLFTFHSLLGEVEELWLRQGGGADGSRCCHDDVWGSVHQVDVRCQDFWLAQHNLAHLNEVSGGDKIVHTAIPTLVEGEEVEEADVTMVVAGGEAYTQQDRFTGRGSTGMFSEEGMEGRERERVRGLCARDGSGAGTSMGARGAGPQLPFIPSRVPSEI